MLPRSDYSFPSYSSAVSVLAIEDVVDGDGVLSLIEQHTVIADTEAQQSLEFSAKRLDTAYTGLGVAVEGGQNLQSGLPLDRADLGGYARLEADSFHSLL